MPGPGVVAWRGGEPSNSGERANERANERASAASSHRHGARHWLRAGQEPQNRKTTPVSALTGTGWGAAEEQKSRRGVQKKKTAAHVFIYLFIYHN
jgi:hypothetical protein